MGTDWGAAEGSGGKAIRVGITHNSQTVNHGDNYGRIDVDYMTENTNGSYSNDAQTLNCTLDITTTINFTNNQGGAVVTRGSRTYSYQYGANEYGSSPGTATFKAVLSGASNGVTPGCTATHPIPARPYGPPADVFWQNAQVQSDTSIRVVWLNQATVGEPYQNMYVDRYTYNYESWVRIANLGGTSASQSEIAAGAVANRKYTYRIWATNVAGGSTAQQTNDAYTTPSAPGSFTRTTSSTTQQLTWTNSVGYSEYKLQLWESVNGGAWTSLADQPAGTTSLNLTGRSLSNKYKYMIQTVGTAASVSSATVTSSESSGTTSPPSAPTNLAPASNLSVEPSVATVMSWTYTSTDTSPQRQFELQHKLHSSSTWISTSPAITVSANPQFSLPAGTYDNSVSVDWQVRVWGTDANPSAWSAAATYVTADLVPVKYPLVINLATGRIEALSGGGAAGVGNANVLYYQQSYATPTTSIGYNHGLGTRGLQIEFYDGSGNMRIGDITKTDNTITMTFATALTGTMYVYGAVRAS